MSDKPGSGAVSDKPRAGAVSDKPGAGAVSDKPCAHGQMIFTHAEDWREVY